MKMSPLHPSSMDWISSQPPDSVPCWHGSKAKSKSDGSSFSHSYVWYWQYPRSSSSWSCCCCCCCCCGCCCCCCLLLFVVVCCCLLLFVVVCCCLLLFVVVVVVVVVDYAKTMMLCKNHDLGVQTMFLSKTMILLTISKTYGSFLLSKTMILLKSLNLRPWKISKLLLESPHTFGCHISTVWKPPHLLLVGGLEHDFYFSIIYGIIQPV